MSGRAVRAWLALAAWLWVACAGEEADPGRRAPVALRAGVVIEPDVIRIGDTAWVEIAVVTPPDYGVRPLEAPAALPGFWVLGAEALPLERSPGRWVHRTRFHVRARETGSFEWPAQTAWVEGPEGATVALPVDARPLHVVEVSPEFTARAEPFSFRAPTAPRAPGGFALPALVGAAATLAALGLVALVRFARRRGATAPAPGPTGAGGGPWRAAQAALETALAEVEGDAVGAADAGSGALRLFVGRRYGIPAEFRTTEELAALEPPFALGTRWPELIRLLQTFDRVRFRPGAAGDPVERAELGAALRAAQAFVADASTGRGAP